MIAGFSLRNTSEPSNYSTWRLGTPAELGDARRNLLDIAHNAGYDHRRLVLSRRWAHLSRVLLLCNDGSSVVDDERTGNLNPTLPVPDLEGFEHSCDGLVTQSPAFVLGLQSGGCRGVWLHDPVTGTIGLLHCGWKGLARGIIANAIGVFRSLGAQSADIRAYIGPGEGDDHYEFALNERSLPILRETGRLEYFRAHLRPMPGRPGQHTLAENQLTYHDLWAAGVDPLNICNDQRSGILDPTLPSSRRPRGSGDPPSWLNTGYMRLSPL